LKLDLVAYTKMVFIFRNMFLFENYFDTIIHFIWIWVLLSPMIYKVVDLRIEFDCMYLGTTFSYVVKHGLI